jgi:LmbE family N-acetylglucosaminyl deacetylase
MTNDVKRKVLALMAHPDDAELCAGGTLARFAARGHDVHIVVASIPDLRETRIEEAQAGASILGATVHFPARHGTWQVEDIRMYELVRIFDQFVQDISPNIVFTHWENDTHYDHTLVAKASLSATRRRCVDLYMCEQPNLYAPQASAFAPDTFVDVSDFMEQRLASVRAHQSQVAGRTYEQHMLARASFYGDRCQCKYAEAFKCVIQQLKV